MNTKYLPHVGIAIVAVVTLISGVMHGRITNRWGKPVDLEKAATRFDKLPKTFGDWEYEEGEPLSDLVNSMLQCSGYINGTYTNKSTGEKVNAFIVLGSPGPISVHTPEVCYSSRDYDIREERIRTAVGPADNKKDEFWAVTLRSTNVNADLLRVYYGWGNQDRWSAPESPRFTFGGDKLLFKIQLASYLPPDTKLEQGDSCSKFLEEFVATANKVLLSSTGETAEKADTTEKAETAEKEEAAG